MVHCKDYVAGWMDSSIHDFLRVFPEKFESMRYALITCLDSNLNPKSILKKSPELRSIQGEARPVGRGLLVPTTTLLEANACKQLFFGFDEVWFFPGNGIAPKTTSTCLLGPARIDQTKLDELGEWLSRNSCSLALGDGEGLNFVVKARGIVKHLLGHTLDQPQLGETLVHSRGEEIAG